MEDVNKMWSLSYLEDLAIDGEGELGKSYTSLHVTMTKDGEKAMMFQGRGKNIPSWVEHRKASRRRWQRLENEGKREG